jgi:hypothetical protein
MLNCITVRVEEEAGERVLDTLGMVGIERRVSSAFSRMEEEPGPRRGSVAEGGGGKRGSSWDMLGGEWEGGGGPKVIMNDNEGRLGLETEISPRARGLVPICYIDASS